MHGNAKNMERAKLMRRCAKKRAVMRQRRRWDFGIFWCRIEPEILKILKLCLEMPRAPSKKILRHSSERFLMDAKANGPFPFQTRNVLTVRGWERRKAVNAETHTEKKREGEGGTPRRVGPSPFSPFSPLPACFQRSLPCSALTLSGVEHPP